MNPRSDTSAQGYFTYAEAYAACARTLIQSPPEIPHDDAPMRMLAFHAIELYLKSFLRNLGHTTGELAAKPFAHDLAALANAARGHLTLRADDLVLLNDRRLWSSAMQTRYLAPTAPDKLLVDPALLCALADRVRTALLAHPASKDQIIVWGEGMNP